MSTAVLRACALAVGVVVAGVIAPVAHAAGPMPPDTFVVCGRNTTGPGAAHCLGLQAAIEKARPVSGTVTIEMMPGAYCPPVFSNLQQVYWQRMNFVGMGLAAYGPTGAPTSFSGPEAKLTTFSWSSACGSQVPTEMIDLSNSGANTGQVGLSNLTVEGGTGGAATGIHTVNGPITLRDVIVEKFTTGLDVTSNAGYSSTSVQNSSLVHNTGAGLSFTGAFDGANAMSVQQSTIAYNGTGIQETGTNQLGLENDTIAHNGTGFSGATSQVTNTINAGNTMNCVSGGTGWEGTGTNGSNLVGSDCAHGASGDVVATGSIGTMDANGGPTYSIMPPAQAANGGVTGWCGGYDQREYLRDVMAAHCDIGSVAVNAVSAISKIEPYPATGAHDFGFVAPGSPGGDLFRVYSTGAGLVYGYDVTLTGAGFAMVGDTCSHNALESNVCSVGVSATPSATHPRITGTLTIKLSTGNLVYTLTAHGLDGSALTAPAPATVNYGRTRTLSTTLTDTTTHKPLKGAQVVLQAKAAGQSAYTDVATRTTSTAGGAAVTVKPRTNTAYRWRYAGSSTVYPATSAGAVVHVAAVVSATLAKTHVARSEPVVVSGAITPKVNGAKVTLQVRSHGHWLAHGTAVVHGSGYAVHTTFATKGVRTLRVMRPATGVTAAGVSRVLTLHVS